MTDAGSRSRDMALVALFAALTAVGAFIRIPVPVVPFTLQFLFTNLAGLLLGAKRGAAAAGVYMAAGLIGVPVFTQGGGPWYVMNPTFGYIAGFAAGAWCAGKISRLRARRTKISKKSSLRTRSTVPRYSLLPPMFGSRKTTPRASRSTGTARPS